MTWRDLGFFLCGVGGCHAGLLVWAYDDAVRHGMQRDAFGILWAMITPIATISAGWFLITYWN